MVTVVFLYNDFLYSTTIDYNEEISFGSNKKDDVKIKDFDKESIKVKFKDSKIMINAKKAYDITVDDMPFNSFVDLDKGVRLFIGDHYSESPCKLKLPYDCIINFGRSSKNDVVIAKRFISGSHFVMRVESGNVHIEDLNSTNGLYLNGKKVTKALMKSGDFVQIFSVVISLTNGELSFVNVGDKLTINEIKSVFEVNNESHIMDNNLIYKRSPWMRASLPSEEIVLAAPPSNASKQRKNRGMLAQLVGGGAMMAAGVVGGVASPALIAARGAGLISPIASVLSNKGMNKENSKEYEEYQAKRREKYGKYIDDQKAKIDKIADLQREIICKENPSPVECKSILFGLTKNLWERSSFDKGFLDVRLGMGYANLCVPVRAYRDSNGFKLENDEAIDLMEQIIEETRIVDNVPACINLVSNNTIGFVGNRDININIVKNMIVEITTAHCFDEVKLVGIFDEKEREIWEPLKWLPHFTSENGQDRLLAFGEKETHDLCESFDKLISERKERIGSSNSRSENQIPKPFYIFIIASNDLAKKEEIMSNLLDNDSEIGITSLFVFDDIYMLPNTCRYIIDTTKDACFYEKNQINNKFYFSPDQSFNDKEFDLFVRRMSAIELDGFATKAPLPDGISFLEGYGVKTVEELNIEKRWEENNTFGSMLAPIGILEGEKTFYLDIHPDHHGSHGLAAGTTGSGKSELIQTWILSMAVNYHPHEVNFVIIDYKGGGMANLMEPLPHVVGKITDLDKDINRPFESLNNEIKKREALGDKYGVNTIGKFNKKVKGGKIREPLMPHLIIVCDEFAELKSAAPDIMAKFDSVARLGRAWGIHLLLATQNPSGVVDEQTYSNSKYKLCLKVNDVTNSRELIKRPDAAYIRQPGRCCILVGENEYFGVFQSYWTGAVYSGNSDEKSYENRIKIIETNGKEFKLDANKKKGADSIDELTAIIKHICSIAEKNKIEKLQGPWLPELSDNVFIDEICTYKAPWLKVPIGIYDLPSAQEQGIQYIDFSDVGHYGIYGAPGTGKTTFLKTLIMSSCLNFTPNDINFYILDFGGWGLTAFSEMPHVGGIAIDGEDEKFLKFEQLIKNEIEIRKKLFLKNTVSDLNAYRDNVSAELPAIVIVVDNMSALFESYPDLEQLFVSIATSGLTYGIYLVYTSTATTGVKYKIMQNVKGAIAFELADKGEYTSIVGRKPESLPNTKGRAIAKTEIGPVVFQTSLFANGDNDKKRTENIKVISKEIRNNWCGNVPKIIPVMPEELNFDDLVSLYHETNKIPVGYDYVNIEPYYFDVSEKYGLMLVGNSGVGKSLLLENLAKAVISNGLNADVVVFDSEKRSLASLNGIAYRYAITIDDTVDTILDEIVLELNARMDKNGKMTDEKTIFIVIDDVKGFVDDISDDALAKMERIANRAKGLKVIILAAGTTKDMLKYSQIEKFTRFMFANQQGVMFDGTPAEHIYFENDLKYSEKDVEAGEGNGFAICQGKCVKIKLAK